MNKSKNYDFYLPSRDTDDVVDVNQLSENFVKIDEELSEINIKKIEVWKPNTTYKVGNKVIIIDDKDFGYSTEFAECIKEHKSLASWADVADLVDINKWNSYLTNYWKITSIESGTGESGATFTPYVSEEGIISWTNDKGLENPASVNIKGEQGESGVHVGSSEPQGDANVWINPEGEADLIFEDIIGMPKYVITERDSVLNNLYAKMNLGNVSIIGFSTDQHISKWEDMQKSTNTKGTIFGLRALNSLAQKIPFNLICLGGDYNTGGSVSSIQQEVLTVQEQFANAPCPVVAVTGNHDAWQNTEDMTSGDIFKSHFMQEVIKNRGLVNLDNMTTNGYIDDSTVNIRYIFVDSDPHKEYTDDDIRSALSQMLRETPEEYKAVVFSHKPLSDELGEDWHDGWNFDSILQTYKNKIICCINGHSHIDSSTISNGILFIQTRAAAPTDYNGNADLSAAGTAKETAFDVFVFDLDNHKIYSIRYGGGEDRSFNIPTTEIINQISVYGYTTDKRVNSSGVEKDEPNHQVTGFIPFTYGDVLYMSSDVFDNVTGNCNIVGYDSDKNFISSSYVDNSYGAILDENNYYSFDPSRTDEGTSQWKNVAYVRVTGTGITGNSVITVNQPI